MFDPQLGDISIVNVGFLAIFKEYRNNYARNPYSPESTQDFCSFRSFWIGSPCSRVSAYLPANQSLTLCGLVPTIQANFDYHLHLVLHHSLACFSRRSVCVSIELFYLFMVKYKLHILPI